MREDYNVCIGINLFINSINFFFVDIHQVQNYFFIVKQYSPRPSQNHNININHDIHIN